MRPILRFCLGVTWFLAFSFAGVARAQESSAELRGRALDPQGAAIGGVTLTITNQATGVYRQTVASDEGSYFVTALSPGLYTLVAEAPGFKKYSRAVTWRC